LLQLTEANNSPSKTNFGEGLAPLELYLRKRPKLILLVSIFITLVSLVGFGRIPFDYNLLRMQPPDAEAQKVEVFLQSRGYSTLFAISIAPNLDEARRRSAELVKLPTVSRVDSLVSLEPHQIQEKEPVISEILSLATQLKLPDVPTKLSGFQLLETYNSYLALKPHLEDWAKQLPQGQFQVSLKRLDRALNPSNPGPLAAGLSSFVAAAKQDLKQQLQFLEAQNASPPDLIEWLPESLKQRCISPSGKICLRIFPRENCWERHPLAKFIEHMQERDPDITGTPILIFNYLEQLKQAYSSAGRNALLVITLLLLAHYRCWRTTLLALLPKLVAVAWMMGGLYVLGESFNAANFLALPLTLGIGLLFGMESLRVGRLPGRALLCRQSAGFAVALSGTTTAIGFSAMMMAEHRGVASFGLVMGLGVAMNLVTSLVALPALMDYNKIRQQKPAREST